MVGELPREVDEDEEAIDVSDIRKLDGTADERTCPDDDSRQRNGGDD
jgi:hypothetical protein